MARNASWGNEVTAGGGLRTGWLDFTLGTARKTLAKLLLLSILIAPIALPARAARAKNPRVGMKKALVQMALFHAFYMFFLIYLYSRL